MPLITVDESVGKKAEKARYFWMQNQVLLSHISDLERRLKACHAVLRTIQLALLQQGGVRLEEINFDLFEIPARPHLKLDPRAVTMKELR